MGGATPVAVLEEQKAVARAPEAAGEERALVPARVTTGAGPMPMSPLLASVSVELDVAVPIRDFRLRDLIGLDRGQVIETRWDQGEDLPLAAGKVQLAWTEFDVIDTRLAVRITRLA